VWSGTPSSHKRTFVHCNLRYSSSLFRTIVKYFITSITQCAVYPIIFLRRAGKCPLFRWRGSRTAYRSAETLSSRVPSFLSNFETETSYDFAKLETPWRESRERRSPREGRYPFCFRRMVCLSSRDVPSTLKVIFRRPENVKPSAVSKRSLDAGVRSFKVS